MWIKCPPKIFSSLGSKPLPLFTLPSDLFCRWEPGMRTRDENPVPGNVKNYDNNKTSFKKMMDPVWDSRNLTLWGILQKSRVVEKGAVICVGGGCFHVQGRVQGRDQSKITTRGGERNGLIKRLVNKLVCVSVIIRKTLQVSCFHNTSAGLCSDQSYL